MWKRLVTIAIVFAFLGLAPNLAHANQVTGSCDGAQWLGVYTAGSGASATSINSSSGCGEAALRCHNNSGTYGSWKYGTNKFAAWTCAVATTNGAQHRTLNAIDQYQYIATTNAP